MVLAANMTKINLTSRKREISSKKKHFGPISIIKFQKKDHRKFCQKIPKLVFGNIIHIPESIGLRCLIDSSNEG